MATGRVAELERLNQEVREVEGYLSSAITVLRNQEMRFQSMTEAEKRQFRPRVEAMKQEIEGMKKKKHQLLRQIRQLPRLAIPSKRPRTF